MSTKTCSKCGEAKDVVQFNKRNDGGDGLQSWCQECSRAKQRRYYRDNKVEFLACVRRRKDQIRAFFEDVKKGRKCSRCPEDHPACLDWHHRDQNDKKGNIAKALNEGWSIATIELELKKCELLCANCHRKEHWEDRFKRRRSR